MPGEYALLAREGATLMEEAFIAELQLGPLNSPEDQQQALRQIQQKINELISTYNTQQEEEP